MILDEEGLYDPSTFNDRLLLGLKGAMSEAELFVMRARLQGGIRNLARRGALKLTLPIGLCYTEADAIVLDPDLQVQTAIREVFLSFQHTGSACATVRHFHQHHLLFPRRIRRGPQEARNRLGGNPAPRCAAGAAPARLCKCLCRMARTRTTKTADGKVHIQELPRAEWDTLVKHAHVGYIRLRGLREK